MGSKEYYRGEVYLASHQDTVTLKRFGFRELEFVGRSLHGVKYAAMWPLDLPVDSLPEAVSGLDYLLDEKTSAAIEVPLEPDEQRQASRIDIPQRAAHEAYRRYVIRDLTEKDYSYSYITVPAETKRYKQYDYDKEDVDQATRGVFRVNPIEEGPFHTKEYVVTKDDPAIGTIRVNPIEEGNFHTPQNFTPERIRGRVSCDRWILAFSRTTRICRLDGRSLRLPAVACRTGSARYRMAATRGR